MRNRCNWVKVGNALHAGHGPGGYWKITRRGKRYEVYRRGGTGRSKGWRLVSSSRSLTLAKQTVGFHLNCKV